MHKTNDFQFISYLARTLTTLAAVILVISLGIIVYDRLPQSLWTKGTGSESSAETVPHNESDDKVENGIHLASGLKVAPGFDLVKAHCTACHSGKLVAQNKNTKEGWKQLITWMQETQGLWDLGESEGIILEYLAQQYSPQQIGRRPILDEIEWYMLDLGE